VGRIARLLSFLRTERNGAKVSDAKVDPGGNPNVTTEHFASAGDDAFPLDTDYVFISSIGKTGREVAVGYLDPINEPKALIGEKRIYGRDAATGLTVVELELKNTGEAEMINANGHVRLQPDGEVNINGARITTGGDVITATGVSLNNHYHEQGNDSNGDSEVATEPPTATE